jgi:hypothetical protein
VILTRRGLLRSHPSRSAYRVGIDQHAAIAAAFKAGPKGSADLTSSLPPRFDQGQSGTCFGHAKAACQYGAAALAGRPLLSIPSPLMIASCTYADVRAASTLPGQPLPILLDTGAQLEDAAAADKWGVASIGVQIAGRNGISDVPDDPPDNSFPEPNVAQLVKGAQRILTGEYKIAVNSDAPRWLAACLDSNVLVWDGFFCDSAFENLGPNDVAGAPDENDPNGGGHSTLYAGYRVVNGKIQGKKVNSWGSVWGSNGTVWCDEAHITAEWELWPFAVVS